MALPPRRTSPMYSLTLHRLSLRARPHPVSSHSDRPEHAVYELETPGRERSDLAEES